MDQVFLQNLYCWFFSEHLGHASSAANKGRSTVNYLDRLYLSCNDHCGFSKKTFFINVFRSRRTHIFFKTDVVRNFAIFAGKHLYWSLFFIKLQVIRSASFFNLFPTTEWKLRNFYEQFFSCNTSGGCFCQFDKEAVQWSVFCRSSLLNQKQNMWDGFH